MARIGLCGPDVIDVFVFIFLSSAATAAAAADSLDLGG